MRPTFFTTAAAALALATIIPAYAQFSSGSTGADGALTIPSGSGVVIFDPVARGIDSDADNVFHFTTINIGDGVTLVFKASKMRRNAPVIFLASGDVTFGAGSILELSGENALRPQISVQTSRRSAEPGPGGFAGGLSSRNDISPGTPATDGYGPAGSAGLATNNAACGGIATSGHATSGHMNVSMIPLVGGAGGGGVSCNTAGTVGGGGGAGGGAIRIVSSTSITFTNNVEIRANGGRGGQNDGATSLGPSGGSGGGGMIHLIAPTVSASSQPIYSVSLTATNPAFGSGSPLTQGSGVVRINANSLGGNFGGSPTLITGPLYSLPLPSGMPEVSISQVGTGPNSAVASPPSGSLTGADVVISSPASVTVVIATKFIPVGTSVKLRISSEVVADQQITCDAVTGTLQAGTANCLATFPLGANITIASATW